MASAKQSKAKYNGIYQRTIVEHAKVANSIF